MWDAARRVRPLLTLVVFAALLVPTTALAQTGQVVEFYHLDAMGSVRGVSNQQGQIVSRHEFLPFGEEWTPATPQRENKLFTGRERDPETGLDYFGARYLDQKIGRFTTIDPVYTLKGNLTDPQRWNRYAFVLNNPLKYSDPDGKVPLPLFGAIAATVYGGWAIYQNVSHGRPPFSGNVGFEAAKGFVFGATLGLAAPALASSSAVLDLGLASGSVTVSPNAVRYGTELLDRYSTKLTNLSRVLTDPGHIEAALNDMKNNPVTIGGRTFDHLTEVQNNLAGLASTISGLKSLVLNENTPDSVRTQALGLLSKATKLYESVSTQGIAPKK